jgi:hypothetical protein
MGIIMAGDRYRQVFSMKVRLPLKPIFTVGFVSSLLFVGLGDSFLPQSIGVYSFRTRNQINNALLATIGQKVKPTGDRLKNSRYAKDNVKTYFDRTYDEAVKKGEYDQKIRKSKF